MSYEWQDYLQSLLIVSVYRHLLHLHRCSYPEGDHFLKKLCVLCVETDTTQKYGKTLDDQRPPDNTKQAQIINTAIKI
jgi:hypothetical protein